MTRTAKRTPFVFLLVFMLLAAMVLPTMKNAEAAAATIEITSPSANYQYTEDGSYIAYGAAASIEIPVNFTLTRPSDSSVKQCRIWVRYRHNGKTLQFYKIDQTVSSSKTYYSGGQTFTPPAFGTVTLEVWVDWPYDLTGYGAYVYTQMSESNFTPEASVDFRITHDHTGKFGYEVPWEEDYTVDKEPTCTEPGSESIHCSVCDGSKEGSSREIPALGHKWGTPSYTWSSDNSSVTASATCENDSAHKETETVNTTRKVTVEPTATSEGKAVYTATFTKTMFTTQTREVAIPKLESSSGGGSGDGSGGSNPGTGSDPGTGSNPGTGSDPGTSTDPGTGSDPAAGSESDSGIQEIVTLKKIKISKASAVSKKKIKISWKKLSKKVRKTARNIQVQVSTDKSFENIVAEKILKNSKTSVSISGLKKNTKYYVRIRVFTEDGKIRYISPWSSVKKVKTKK